MKSLYSIRSMCVLLAGASLLSAALSPAQAQTGAAPNQQMQFVLDALQSLEPLPLETLIPEEARKQPGPTDAVKVLIKKHDIKAPEPVGEVDNQSIEGGGGAKVKIRIYTP